MDGCGTVSLADQIMDELMDRAMTATELARALGARWDAVAAQLFQLKASGLVLTVGLKFGSQESKWAMARTRKVTR